MYMCLLMTANKPETAVQGCAFFSLWSHTQFLFMHMYIMPVYSVADLGGGGGFRGLQPPQKVSSPSFVEPR